MSDSIADQFASDSVAPNAAQAPKSIADQFSADSQGGRGNDGLSSPENTTSQNFWGGIGHGMVTTVANAKQGLDKLADSLNNSLSGTPVGNAINWANNKLGLDSTDQALANTNQFIKDNHKYGDSITNTTSGKIGNFLGNTAIAAPLMVVPGANTYAGATALGGLTGLATTEGDLNDRITGAAEGAAGGFLGKGLGDVVGAGASKLGNSIANSNAAQEAMNSSKDTAISLAQKYGYKLPPQDVNPTMINAALNGFSGKIKTSQAASQANQDVTNGIVKQELGLTANSPLNLDVLNGIRQKAGQAYNVIRGTGTVTSGDSYTSALDNILQNANGQAKSFPGLKNDDITNVISTLRQPTFEAGDAVDATKFLRNMANKSYAAGDKDTGSAYKQASGALEDALDQHLQNSGNPQALSDFRDARQTIAKTYSVEKALNPVTGNVDAGKLAAQLQKGKPLSGGLQDIAQVASNFPKATQMLKENYQPMSPLDYVGAALTGSATSAATGSPYGIMAAGASLARPAVRSALLSSPIQSMNAKAATDYSGGLLTNYVTPALQNTKLKDLLRVGGVSAAINAGKQ